MSNTRKLTALLLTVCLLAIAGGCESYAEKKEAAYSRWHKATAQAKIPVARELFENNKLDEAEKTIAQCIAADPEMPQAHILMGEIHFAYGRLSQAHDSFSKAVDLDPKLDQAWFSLGTLSRQQHQPTDALRCYRRAMSIKPAQTEYITAVVEIYAAQGDYEEALELLEEKIAQFPSDATLKVAAADIHNRLGQTDRAIGLYSQALMHKTGDRHITETLGYCYITKQQWKEAVETFESLLKGADLEQKQACLQIMAMCSMNDGQYSRAFSYFDKLSVDQRDSAELWLQMGQAALGADSSHRAAACARRALALRPGWPDAIAVQGCSLYLSQDYTAAIKIFRKITADDKLAGFAWLMTGRCYQQLGQIEPADKAYEKAVNLNSESQLVTLLTKPYQQVK